MTVLTVVSIAGSVWFVVLRGKRRLVPSFTVLTESKKMKTFVLTVPMIIGFLIMPFWLIINKPHILNYAFFRS